MAQMNLSMKQKQTHRPRKHTCGCQVGWGKDGGKSTIERRWLTRHQSDNRVYKEEYDSRILTYTNK